MIFIEKNAGAPVKRAILLLLLILPLTACTRAPSVDIVGSFFPAWLLCLMVAVVITVSVQLVLARLRLTIAYPVLFYLSLATLLTFALWLIFFH
jgi:YtcA family